MKLAALAVLLLTPATVVAQAPSPGERLYKGHCAVCHSVDGSGQSPIGRKLGLRDLRHPDVQSQPDSRLNDIITKGRGNMPPQRGRLNKSQITLVIQYLRQIRNSEAATSTTAPKSTSE